MGSLATFKSTYLDPNAPVLPQGARQQLAGAVYALEQQIANGASVATAANNVTNARINRIVHKAQRQSSPFQMNLVNDYRGISAP